LQEGKKLAYDQIVYCNIGNPQQLNQRPITFFRQVASLVENPALLDFKNRAIVEKLFPKDAIKRAEQMIEGCGGNIGAYSHSQGIPMVRQQVASFISSTLVCFIVCSYCLDRDEGIQADPDKIFLTSGASQGVQFVLECLIAHEKVGIMIPIPQYPLYTASLALNNGKAVPYYLNEEARWDLQVPISFIINY
jgi:aspartate/methionine/tyrosine aminotransferase